MDTTLRKDLPGAQLPADVYRIRTDGGPPVTVHAPVHKSVGCPGTVLARLINEDRIGEMRDELAAIEKAAGASLPGTQARFAEYERLAKTMTDPREAAGFRRAAEQLRKEAGI